MRPLLCLLLFACSTTTTTTGPEPVSRARTDPTPPPPRPDGPSEADCDALFTHAFALSIADRKPSDADRNALHAELRPDFVADCRAGSRAYQQCGIGAKTTADLAACK